MSDTANNTIESNVRSYSRAFPATFSKARGSLIFDQEGKEYIDFFCGAGALNYGHNDPDLKNAMINYIQSDGIMHSLDMTTESKNVFIETFVKNILVPRKLDYKIQFTGPTGTNAVEAAIKLARLATSRNNVIAFTHSFHGVSLGALATTSNSWFRDAAGVNLGNVTFMPYENYLEGLDTLGYLEKALSDKSSGLDKPAAIIVEIIQGEGGVNIASDEWMQRLRKITASHGIILIVDDIQAGCGRSGEFFSFEKSGVVPDMVTLSKSLSGSGLPMSLLLMSPELDVWKPGQHNGTFRGNNLAFISATVAIEKYWANDNLSKSIQTKELRIKEALQSIVDQNQQLGLSLRGRGVFFGLDFGTRSEKAKIVSKYCFENGLIIELAGAEDEVLKIMPAINIPDDLLNKGLNTICDAIKSVQTEY